MKKKEKFTTKEIEIISWEVIGLPLEERKKIPKEKVKVKIYEAKPPWSEKTMAVKVKSKNYLLPTQ